jgi:hypothetical protein
MSCWTSCESILLISTLLELGIHDFKRISLLLNGILDTKGKFTSESCFKEFQRISQNTKSMEEIISNLNVARIEEIYQLLSTESSLEDASKWKKHALGLLAKISSMDSGKIFLKENQKEQNSLVKRPMYLEFIKSRIVQSKIKNVMELHRDLTLIFANATMYNPIDSEIYKSAIEMKAFVDDLLERDQSLA